LGLLFANSQLFSIRHRHNSPRLIEFFLLASNATFTRLAAQSLVGNASDSPQYGSWLLETVRIPTERGQLIFISTLVVALEAC
jgi:type IV secretory pathway protease TraF